MFTLLINTKLILIFFSGEPKLPLIPKVGPSPSTKNYSCDCQLLSTPKIITFLEVPLSKLHKCTLSIVIT